MKTIYLDIFSGISGDMFVGALLDLGAGFKELEMELAKLRLEGYHLHAARRQKSSISGTKFDVHIHDGGDDDHEHEHEHTHEHEHAHAHTEHGSAHAHGHHHHPIDFDHGAEHTHSEEHSHAQAHHHDPKHGRTFAEIRELIQNSGLSGWVKEKSIAIFLRVANAEGKIHGKSPEAVHFHEVGAVDSIVDIVGACIALELLGRPRLISAPVVEGRGWIRCAHGRFPIPTPATLEILGARGIPISQTNEANELVTPTGAAILAEMAEAFGPLHGFIPTRIGYGLGTRDNQTRPNVLRAILGESGKDGASDLDWETDEIVTLQTNLDDINSEILGRFMEKALNSGAVDVFYTPIQMKKNRPGVLLTVLCSALYADSMSELILRETSAFGVRRTLGERRKLRREIQKIQTSFGPVDLKIGRLNGKIVQTAPEYESCKALAEAAGKPLKEIYEAAIRAANGGA
jgi:uncharacterized protein (TIGR00299 family) protein